MYSVKLAMLHVMHDEVFSMCRDLAQQVHDVISDMRKHLNAPTIRNALIVGGTDPRASKAQLQGGVHIVTGTSGMPALRCPSRMGNQNLMLCILRLVQPLMPC